MGVTESVEDESVQYHLRAIRNNLYTDACFLKVEGKVKTAFIRLDS